MMLLGRLETLGNVLHSDIYLMQGLVQLRHYFFSCLTKQISKIIIHLILEHFLLGFDFVPVTVA